MKLKIVQPFAGRSFHICGEAYSDAQGWAEGALQTADMVLEKFGVKPLCRGPIRSPPRSVGMGFEPSSRAMNTREPFARTAATQTDIKGVSLDGTRALFRSSQRRASGL